jgi:type III secretion system FlhB-like substrate exporter
MVFPPWCINVVRFYMPRARRDAAVAMKNECSRAPVLILSGRGVAPDERVAAAEACYPRVIEKLNLVEVRAR